MMARDRHRVVVAVRHEDNERSLKSNLSLCNETLHMVAYLTSDPDIQKPFLREELLLRLAEMLLCVLKQLVSRGFATWSFLLLSSLFFVLVPLLVGRLALVIFSIIIVIVIIIILISLLLL